jgi:hypothetical protein
MRAVKRRRDKDKEEERGMRIEMDVLLYRH